MKTQLIVNAVTSEIICTAHAEGSCHDFKLYSTALEALWQKGFLCGETAAIRGF